MVLVPRLGVAVGVLAAIVASQFPEFAQQYRQRLGGAIDELSREVTQFNAEAQIEHMSTRDAIARLKGNTDTLAQKRGMDMTHEIGRLTRLEHQRDGFIDAGPLKRLVVFVEDFDPFIARRAYASFEPAVPTTSEGLLAAALGFVTGTGAVHAFAWPIRRRRQMQDQDAAEAEAAEREARVLGDRLRRRISRATLPPLRPLPGRREG